LRRRLVNQKWSEHCKMIENTKAFKKYVEEYQV
jgi:hypothetical protein